MATIKNQNNVTIAGEVLDLTNYKCFNEGQANESWGYTLEIEVNPETQQTVNVEFFTSIKSERTDKAMTTIYENVKTRARDGQGDIVRCTGKLTSNDYYSKGELVKKIVIAGDFCNRKGEPGNSKYDFTPCATFHTLAYVRNVIEEEEKTTLETLVNEYKTKTGKIRGHYVDFVAEGAGAKGVLNTINVTKEKGLEPVLKLSGRIEKEIVVNQVDESTIEFEDEDGAWGEELERIQKSNERKRKLLEEGIKKETTKLVLTGAHKGLSKEDIEDNKINFTDYDIDDMIADIEQKMNDSKLRDEQRYGSKDEVVPF